MPTKRRKLSRSPLPEVDPGVVIYLETGDLERALQAIVADPFALFVWDELRETAARLGIESDFVRKLARNRRVVERATRKEPLLTETKI